MALIITIKEIPNLVSQLKNDKKKIVLAGGSFDILHAGHIEFLRRAKDLGDTLIVFLESDEKIKKIKGENRPVNPQNARAAILANLPIVSYVLPLTSLKTNQDYEILVKRLEPDIIAVSGSDKVFEWEKKFEKEGHVRIVKVMERYGNHSTTNLIGKMTTKLSSRT